METVTDVEVQKPLKGEQGPCLLIQWYFKFPHYDYVRIAD